VVEQPLLRIYVVMKSSGNYRGAVR
jgi:hypothetical protein